MAKAKAKAPPPHDPAELAVHETLRRAQQVWSSGLGTTLVILKEADAGLAAQLGAIVAKHGGPSGKFTEASAVVYRKQIGLATEYLEKRLAGHTHAQALKAIASSVKSTISVAKQFEHKFTGITRPLALESQQMQDATIRGVGASLLQRHVASFNRYGKAMVSDFEKVLRTAQVQGLTHEQTVSLLVEAGKTGGHSAGSLHANEPGYFPQPTSYVKRRYWAERIVRTETAHALSAGALQAMNVTRNTEFPDLQKKILATFDARTAPDSVAVHGQVRPLEGYFIDGAGRQYLHPPARPNDRECIIPWRPHWEPTPSTQPPSVEVQAQAQLDAQPPPPPAAVKRKGELKDALAKAKAKVLGQKAQLQAEKEQAQAFSLAQAKAQAAQAEGEVSLGHAVLADKAALQAAAEKVSQAELPGAKFNAAKAKAQAYLEQKQAIAKAKAQALAAERQAKAEALAAERQAAVVAEAKAKVEGWKLPDSFDGPSDVVATLKHLAKEKPKVFAELAAQVTGKDAGKVLAQIGKPLQLGALSKQVGKKLQPQLNWPKPKPKAPKYTPEQLLAQKKATLLGPNVSLKEAGAAFTDAEIAKLLEGNPLVLEGEAEEAVKMSPLGKGAYLHQVTNDWEKAKAAAAQAELKDLPSGGKHYVDVYQGGKKVAYYFKEGTAEAPVYAVKPPLEMQGSHQPKTFTSQVEATAYALDVGEHYASMVGAKQAEAASIKAAAAKAEAEFKKQSAEQRAAASRRPWSSEWKEPERPEADLKTKAAKQLADLPKTRSGKGLAMDEDYIENFDVSWTRETVGGKEEVVVRFKVTGHREQEVRGRLEQAGAKAQEYGYRKLKGFDNNELQFDDKIHERAIGVRAVGLEKSGVKISMQHSLEKGGEGLAAGHNLVEMRFEADPEKAMAKAQKGFDLLGIGTAPPTPETKQAYTRAKIMAYLDPDSARELKSLKERTPAAVAKVWEKSVLRNPKLAQVEADAELREVSPGHHALYSPKVQQQLEESGVKWLAHRSNSDPEVVEQMLARPTDGLLSSRGRRERGLFVDGMSTSDDFVTGGADSAFLRLKTTDPSQIRDVSEGRWMFQIDTSELGRLDSYWTNHDTFGRVQSGARKTVAEMADVVRQGDLGSTNELMLQRNVSRGAIRRVIVGRKGDLDDLLGRLRARGITEINGIPLEDFVVLTP